MKEILIIVRRIKRSGENKEKAQWRGKTKAVHIVPITLTNPIISLTIFNSLNKLNITLIISLGSPPALRVPVVAVSAILD